MRRLVLMPDYDADPLWDDESGVMVPLSTLPLSEGLKERLTAWRQRWDDAATRDALSGEDQPLDPRHWREERELWMALRKELEGEYEVGVASPGVSGRTWSLTDRWRTR